MFLCFPEYRRNCCMKVKSRNLERVERYYKADRQRQSERYSVCNYVYAYTCSSNHDMPTTGIVGEDYT